MAELEDLVAIRGLLNDASTALAGVSAIGAPKSTPGLLVTIIKAIQFTLPHIESLEERVKALESRER